jgi:hypothetical protein
MRPRNKARPSMGFTDRIEGFSELWDFRSEI